jgi:hypothetical protein
MEDFKWATRAPSRVKITGPKGEERIDLSKLNMTDLRAWVDEADGVLNDMRVEIHDYLAMRTESQRKAVDAFRVKRAEETTVKDAAKARKAAGVNNDAMLSAVRMIMDLQVKCGVLTAEQVANNETAIENGGLDVIALRLGLVFKAGK